MQTWGLLNVLLNLVDLNLQVVQRLLKAYKFSKIRRKIYFSADFGHGWNFKSICTAFLAKYFETEDGKHEMGPTFAQ